MSLRITPAASHQTTTTNLKASAPSAPSAPGLPDILRANLTSPPPAQDGSVDLQSAHPLEVRLKMWTQTQENLKMAGLRRTFGMAEPIRRGMELNITRAGEWRPAVLGGGAGVGEEILTGRSEQVTWEDVYTGDETREPCSMHAEMERRVGMDKW
ncbi:MAG: 20S proteasome maturation factor [Cirrosporium novae-zelandiae]|nr:MAG: 20S proteasome maturation factor [Cirrosporium novae-zelandiae]